MNIAKGKTMAEHSISRRRLMIGAGVALCTPTLLRAQTADPVVQGVRRNLGSFISQRWQAHFDDLGKGAIVADTTSRALHYWNAGGSDYRVYPTSVPATEELTKRGYTQITRKKEGPDWTPTASMMERFPEYKYMPPGPGNPLGTHAMYLGWPAYIIHGTHDTRKIGRRSSDGCIGLYNEEIEELFARCPVGTQVRII